MNQYYFLLVWLQLFAMPCCAMTNPFAFGNFGPKPQQPVENVAPEEEVPYEIERTPFGYEEPELTGVYKQTVITADDEPSAYIKEQIPQFQPHMAPEEFKQSMESSVPEASVQSPVQTPPSVQQITTPVTSSSSTPIESQLSAPTSRPSTTPSTPSAAPTAPSTPVTPPPARQAAPGKAHESITKANSKLSSALRRLDAIKGYYKEINQEERKVIKKKTENIWKEYQGDLTKFVQRIEQVKNELGGRADQSKLTPFNTFIDLTNKLSQGIKKL